MLDFQQIGENMKEFYEILKTTPLFMGVEEKNLEDLVPKLQPIRWVRQRGETVLQPGEMAPGVGILLFGGLRVLREDFWGNRSLLTVVEPGELFAEVFACSGVPLTVRVEAAQEVEVVFFPSQALLKPPPEGSFLPQRLLGVLAQKNLMLNQKLNYLSQRSTRAKVLSYLSDQAKRAGSPSFVIPMDRQELADYLAVDRSALSALLGQLRRAGVLEFHRSHFILLAQGEEQ